jgi:hypothetical protein
MGYTQAEALSTIVPGTSAVRHVLQLERTQERRKICDLLMG